MKKIALPHLLLCSTGLLLGSCALRSKSTVVEKDALPPTVMPVTEPAVYIAPRAAADNTKVQVALLLDTSNSMDGLIEQAKSRLWNIVNTLTTLKYNGETPNIEIALYEYGNSGLSPKDNYIRQVTPMTTDLDLVSEKLFALRTNGGEEYCGAVIAEAVKQLSWGKEGSDMKLIYIAGNEPFNQGGVSYKESVSTALAHQIYVNTIFCGGNQEGVSSFWQDGANRGQGKYFSLDADNKVTFIATPYDDKISACNEQLNNTYIAYGANGNAKKMNQSAQDINASHLSSANKAERSVFKSKSVYMNTTWDIVDLAKTDSTAITKIKQSELPAELRDKSAAEVKAYVTRKHNERDSIQKEMTVLALKRQQYIDAQMKAAKVSDDIGEAIKTSIYAVARTKGYTITP